MSDGNIDTLRGSPRPPVLIARAGTPIGLAIARGLRGTGAQVVGASLTPTASTCRSRLWHEVLPVAAPTEAGWLAALREAHARYGRMVLIPADDMMVRLAAERPDELGEMFDYVMPPLPTVDRLLDKSAFHEWALAHDFPVPKSAITRNWAELRAALDDMTFPVVFKPFERTLGWQALSRYKVWRFESAADLERLGFDPFDAADRFVVQEFIPGSDSDVYFCLVYRDREGRELASQVGRKLGQWPAATGNTALAVTHRDERLLDLTRKMLDAAGHVGFGSLEVRVSERDGRMVIIEPTVGRPDLQTALAAAAGCNLVEVGYRDALGLQALPMPRRREAIWMHETAMPRSVLTSVRRPAERRTLLGALRTRRAPVGVFFSFRDPVPFLLEAVTLIGKVARAARFRLGGPPRSRDTVTADVDR
ncbi:hypothetical protein [Pseudonocardia acaciae]|uniref:carboxylate--amine ligase n=1 Tax=Pseudonocardia acaciae TaxID=551276 RepID=UPI0012EE5A25|nr:hypothetical protein [Pseudonocardia acaciae]